ncbi:MAG: hypothetical protein QM796_02015 [Chthoniobacteraceae bacterium]
MKRTPTRLALAAILTGGLLLTQSAMATLTADQSTIQNLLPTGVFLEQAPYATYDQLANATAAAVATSALTPDRAIAAAFALDSATTGGTDYRNADGAVVQSLLTQVGGNKAQVIVAVNAAFSASNIGSVLSSVSDDTAIAALLSSGIFNGLQKAVAKKALIGPIRNAAVTAAIKAAVISIPDGADIAVPKNGPVDNALGSTAGDGLGASKAAAGVVTGLVSQYQLGTTKSNSVVAAIVKNAVKADKTDYLQIAQAAAQAAAYVFGLSNTGGANAFAAGFIINAVKAAFGTVGATKAKYISDAVNFGKSLAIAYGLTSAQITLGAGAAGIADYTYTGGSSGTPVTDITGL